MPLEGVPIERRMEGSPPQEGTRVLLASQVRKSEVTQSAWPIQAFHV
jgi:hypothetical protein